MILAKFTLYAAFYETTERGRLERIGDELADQLRNVEDAQTVASEVEGADDELPGPEDDDADLTGELEKAFPEAALSLGPVPGIRVLGRNGTFKHAHLKRNGNNVELWLGTPKETYPLVTFPSRKKS